VAAHLLGVGHHPEVTADPKEQISTRTDRGLCRDHDHPDNTEAPTEVVQDHTPLDLVHHQEDVGDGVTVPEGMVQDGEAQVIAVIAVTMIEAEAGVVEEEAVDGVNTERLSHLTGVRIKRPQELRLRYRGCYFTLMALKSGNFEETGSYWGLT
jgi:hypothetical protein